MPYILIAEYKTINLKLTKKHSSFWLALIVPESAKQAFRKKTSMVFTCYSSDLPDKFVPTGAILTGLF